MLQSKSARLDKEPDHVRDIVRRQIAAATALYPCAKQKIDITLPLFSIPANAKHEPIRKLKAVFESHQNDFIEVIIFSSIATKDIVPNWSDVDILAIIKQETLHNPNRFHILRRELIRAEELLYIFDPYQHHGIQFVTETDLRFYPESFLPVSTLENAASLICGRTLQIHVRDSTAEQAEYFYGIAALFVEAAELGELRHHGKDGVYLKDNFANKENNFYQLKYFISVILLLPSLYLGLVDKSVYKRESFSRISEYFSEQELELIRRCERVRNLFGSLRAYDNKIPEEVISVLGPHYLKRAHTLTQVLIASYERRATHTA